MLGYHRRVTHRESGARARTRAAILDAAITLLAGNGSASLADVAAEAGVGRSTLHRYYAERSHLLRDVAREALRRVDTAVRRAEGEAGDFSGALRRAIDTLLELGPIMMFISYEPAIVNDLELWEELRFEDHDVVVELFARPDANLQGPMTPQWAAGVFWGLLNPASDAVQAGTVTRAEAVDLVMFALTRGIIHPA